MAEDWLEVYTLEVTRGVREFEKGMYLYAPSVEPKDEAYRFIHGTEEGREKIRAKCAARVIPHCEPPRPKRSSYVCTVAERALAVRADHASGMHVGEIAKKRGISQSQCYKILDMKKRRLTLEEVLAMRQMYREGMSAKDIAVKFRVALSTVFARCKGAKLVKTWAHGKVAGL